MMLFRPLRTSLLSKMPFAMTILANGRATIQDPTVEKSAGSTSKGDTPPLVYTLALLSLTFMAVVSCSNHGLQSE